ncbi:hypothetical protein CC80DRAFT_559809 [Byssothecium circinans]|uniref:1-alkyl-2-acetylglycerophosphocholine esterase n=1 Tax=Byssothecium circinans TaxID=147558 RepID=A0A6A5TZB8_9PLEO|nr:hypothetical protein CC80DRAFT_559809 [Byssothecium circinans]
MLVVLITFPIEPRHLDAVCACLEDWKQDDINLLKNWYTKNYGRGTEEEESEAQSMSEGDMTAQWGPGYSWKCNTVMGFGRRHRTGTAQPAPRQRQCEVVDRQRTRNDSNNYLSELASYGYAIPALDHPGEAPYLPLPSPYNGSEGICGYPDFNAFPPTNEITFAVFDYRVSDILAALSDPFFPALVRQYGAPFNLSHFGVFGHSIGGAAAAEVMTSNSSHLFKVGANLDGTFFQFIKDGSTPARDLNRPFLELVSENHFHGNASSDDVDASFKYFNDAQSGLLRMVQVNGTRHLDFSDIPLWIDLLDQRAVLNRTWVGSADGVRVNQLCNALPKEFFGSVEGYGLGGVDGWVDKAPELFLLVENVA